MNDIIVLSVFALFFIFIAGIYNRVIRKRNEADKAFGTLGIMLKKRYDLLPNLVETAKQYALFEAAMFSGLEKSIQQLNPQTDNQIDLHASLNRQMNSIIIQMSKLPELKTSIHFLKLQAAWNETEEQISAARRYYNTTVTEYNNALQTFPANILMKKSKFQERKYLEFDPAVEENPSAANLFNSHSR